MFCYTAAEGVVSQWVYFVLYTFQAPHGPQKSWTTCWTDVRLDRSALKVWKKSSCLLKCILRMKENHRGWEWWCTRIHHVKSKHISRLTFFKRFLQNQENCPQIVVVMRDIKDVLASQYHHLNLFTGLLKLDLSFDDFLAMHDANRVPYGNPIDYNLGWWAYKDHPRVLIVRYEDMLHDTKAVVKSLGEFINRPVDEATAIEIAEICSFTQMKGRAARYQTTEFDWISFFRKGISCDWKNHFSDEQAHHIDDIIKEKCHPQGLYV